MITANIEQIRTLLSETITGFSFQAENNPQMPDVIGIISAPAQDPDVEASLMLSVRDKAIHIVPSFFISNDGEMTSDEFSTCLKVLSESYPDVSIVPLADDEPSYIPLVILSLASLTRENIASKVSGSFSSLVKIGEIFKQKSQSE